MIRRSPGWTAICPRTLQHPYRDWCPIKQAWYGVYREMRAIRSGYVKEHLRSPWIPDNLINAVDIAIGVNSNVF